MKGNTDLFHMVLRCTGTHVDFRQRLRPLVVGQVGPVSCIGLQFAAVLFILLSFWFRLRKDKVRTRMTVTLPFEARCLTPFSFSAPSAVFSASGGNFASFSSSLFFCHTYCNALFNIHTGMHRKAAARTQWRLLARTLSSSDWSFSASSSVSSWILGPSSFFFFFSSASLAALSAFSFRSFSAFICFSLWDFCASLLWRANASLMS